MNLIEQHGLISQELEIVRREFQTAIGSWPNDVQALILCIHDRCFETDFNINTAIEHCSIGASSIYSRFRQCVGQTPAIYLERCRLIASCRLLGFRHLHVSDIALSIGYEHRERFSRAFARNYSCSPSEYQAKAAEFCGLSSDGSVGTASVEFVMVGVEALDCLHPIASFGKN